VRLIFLNLFRNKISTLLTAFGIAIALFLFCILETILWAFSAGLEVADASRLMIRHKESLVFELPYHYSNKIKPVPGVKKIAYGNWFGGVYDANDKEFFAQFAVDLAGYFELYPEFSVSEDQKKALLADRQGCMIGEDLARRLNKKLGDPLFLRGGIFYAQGDQNIWKFTIKAIYTSDRKAFDKSTMFFHWDYLNEGRRTEDSKDQIGFFILQINDPKNSAEISSRIDKIFEHSDNRTLTMTEKAFNLEFISMMGNISLMIRIFGTVVVFTILLISINTNMMSARERLGEIGLLKSLGFSPAYIFRLYLGESLLLCLFGGFTGLFLGYFCINILGYNPKPDFFPIFYINSSTLALGVGISIFTGILSGITPAIISSRISASEALRSV
jgi:putative ABC transport system permease protein